MTNKPGDYPSFKRPLEIELIRAKSRGTLTAKQALQLKELENRQLKELENRQLSTDDAFIVKKAAKWLELSDDQRQNTALFGDFWYKGELCILFADTSTGKSILAVQIADAITGGDTQGMEVQRQAGPVLYFDFELSAAQFAGRYTSADSGSYAFADDFYRIVINPDGNREKKFASYHDYLINAFENLLVTTKAQIVIIDNITSLRSGTENAAAALKLMTSLNQIKNRYDASVLVLAHTPKRNPVKPISRNDLQGSKMLLNLADSSFAIGESQTKPGLRYLKQIKQRSGEAVHGALAVKLCRIVKHKNFLKFDFAGNSAEAAHLLPYTNKVRKAAEDQIARLHACGQTIRFIADDTGQSVTTVFRILKRLKKAEEGAAQSDIAGIA